MSRRPQPRSGDATAPRRLSLSQARDQIEQLRDEIRGHDHRYYVLDRPTISDAAYDRLFARLQQLEAAFPELGTPDSPTQRVGGAPLPSFPAVSHLAPMLSIESVTKPADVERFVTRIHG